MDGIHVTPMQALVLGEVALLEAVVVEVSQPVLVEMPEDAVAQG